MNMTWSENKVTHVKIKKTCKFITTECENSLQVQKKVNIGVNFEDVYVDL